MAFGGAKKKVLAVGCAIAFASALAGPALAFANNYRDRPYDGDGIVYAEPHNITYTDSGRKTDESSSWNENYWATSTHTVEVAARWRSADDPIRFVGSKVYTWDSGYDDYMLNQVNEEHYWWALLWFNNLTNVGFNAEGVWSPDSI